MKYIEENPGFRTKKWRLKAWSAGSYIYWDDLKNEWMSCPDEKSDWYVEAKLVSLMHANLNEIEEYHELPEKHTKLNIIEARKAYLDGWIVVPERWLVAPKKEIGWTFTDDSNFEGRDLDKLFKVIGKKSITPP